MKNNEFYYAFNILMKVNFEGKKSNELLNEIRDNKKISYISEIVYGVLENRIYLDHIIKNSSKKFPNKKARTILQIGLYNIRFLNKKNYAIVNNLVEFTKGISRGDSGYINAILRRAIDDKSLWNIEETDKYKYLSIKYSTSLDIVRYLIDCYDFNFVEKLLESNNKNPVFSIRVNNLKCNKIKLVNMLSDRFILRESKISNNSLIVENPNSILETEAFKKGYFIIQSEASSLVCDILDPLENSEILDLCAAPGTKTSNICQITKNSSKIIANDISKSKNYLIEDNIKRLGLRNIKITNYDASEMIDEFKNRFDYVLCDLPCAGLGLMGRKPEIRYNRKLEDIIELSKLQRKILNNAVMYLKVGGILVFSTCSLGKLENEDNFKFINNKSFMKNIKIENNEYIELNAVDNHTDGFFMAKFIKQR
ncbi:MAG: 16S rRNA (cytosine(967)-C(5))-methyltransferase RsmB [Tissierellia bacterium]|nr:16S rRNA (cytosine(967)-C(5))-methyltransferase RsmB [Tissierellia bacterium]